MMVVEDFDVRRVPDSKMNARITSNDSVLERGDDDDCYRDCRIKSRDISDIIWKAICAAEAEARSANAPDEAVKAAGDAAVDLVKIVASEEFKSANDEDAAFWLLQRLHPLLLRLHL
ncbi:hypothetical protein HN51_025746 [Arachis hypogaea]|uniref:Uncharacterized protein n=1 Tax=Arachis hypogaea TaxID=3818 RepID=A0A445CF25_ARAHY|nr:DDB1- and CUL4-associated factor homolog 1 [Arachis hypogaea]XP_029143799.1 DDB1- and CUL4-associated factor homolog 1 [Arachis hypogaea]XP_029143800.1 DDB1- and CUL4-associated factor homolog 1 [Arachis hypogaea]XP_029143801.1 DDB1- and CUL4-associated factor homolog 1 [Arachis hypogaea]XP_057723260.1 DDB1- and CUL4-associated factor homolog 1-like [Arachis stenosperma]QHO28244.1 uncharacterized protein DS421_7g214990 [Arachis hypogaea]RYR49516.1 hypothetical protein Ahy_A07g036030 [Arach